MSSQEALSATWPESEAQIEVPQEASQLAALALRGEQFVTAATEGVDWEVTETAPEYGRVRLVSGSLSRLGGVSSAVERDWYHGR